MRQKWGMIVALIVMLQTLFGAAASAAADGTTKFRVYQNDSALKEFATQAQAVAYAKRYSYSHVEKIAGRVWVWDNFPAYQVSENGVKSGAGLFRTLAEAKAYAKGLKFPQIRDLAHPGWISGIYPGFRMYQGDKTLPDWTYATLNEAKKAAQAYSNIHIVELATNQWIWDNLSGAQKAAQRQAVPVYDIEANGVSAGGKLYASLLDAMRAAAKQPGSTIVNTATGSIVYDTTPAFTVTQNGRTVKSFSGLGGALAYAKTLAAAAIVRDGQEWWTNVPYWTVLQGGNPIRQFNTRAAAVAYARGYADSAVASADGRTVWSNKSRLTYLGWNGVAQGNTILSQAADTQGMDIDSPSWFELSGADGSVADYSDDSAAAELKRSGKQLAPLVNNNFDTKMTSAFLLDAGAQTQFIGALVGRLTDLGADGVNLDFEMLAGDDRARYTAFVRSLTEAAHRNGLKVSIDLPRGDVAWDRLTAYDQAALAGIVDTIVIMAYDEHWAGGGDIGSVSGLPWTEEGVRQFLAYGIPRGKLMLGIPFYVRDWRIDASGEPIDSGAVMMDQVPSLIERQGAIGTYDPESGQMRYTYAADGFTHVFWAETADTIKARIAIAKKYDLAGVAAWRLGYESPALWTMMLQQK